jgi:hypothetical protein
MLAMLANCRRYLCLGLLALGSGCAICGSCDDETYGAYGGRWTRLDPCFGRVGSAFTPEVGTKIWLDELVAPEPEPEEVAPGIPQPLDSSTPPADDAAPTPPMTLMPDAQSEGAATSVLLNPDELVR